MHTASHCDKLILLAIQDLRACVPSNHHAHLQLVPLDNGILLALQFLNVPIGAQISPTQPLPSLLDQPK